MGGEIICKSCGHKDLGNIISFGKTALSDRLLIKEELGDSELKFPLNLVFCPDCAHVQIAEIVSPDILFDEHYTYFSSVIPALVQHSKENAIDLIKLKNLNSESLVVELASQSVIKRQNGFTHANHPVRP